MDTELLQVKIMTPHAIIFQGQALAVSSTNSEGIFDVLPEHANFITLIENQSIKVIKTNKETQEFNFTQAILVNLKNACTIYAKPTTL